MHRDSNKIFTLRKSLLQKYYYLFWLNLFLWIAAPFAHANERPMQFRIASDIIKGEYISWIAAEGAITKSSADKLKKFLQKYPYSKRPKTIRLHSGGGHLMGGLALGRLIRASNLKTEIGKTTALSHKKIKGRCASSCAYTFLGGTKRQANIRELGIHGYGFRIRKTGEIIKRHQITSTKRALIDHLLKKYIKEMNIHPLFLKRALDTPFEYMYYFGKDEISRLETAFRL